MGFFEVFDDQSRAVGNGMRKGSPCFFVVVFAMNDNGVCGFAEFLGTVPDLLYKRAGGVVGLDVKT